MLQRVRSGFEGRNGWKVAKVGHKGQLVPKPMFWVANSKVGRNGANKEQNFSKGAEAAWQ